MDPEDKLDELDRRLRELRAELDPPRAAPTAAAPAAAAAAPHRSSPADPLDQFGLELRRLTTELVAAWDRVAAAQRGEGAHRIVLEAQADLHALAALERALAAAPAVRTLDLRAYAGGHASLVVEVS